MTTHDYILTVFIAYFLVKAAIFLPLIWAAIIFWWNNPTDSSSNLTPTN
jgi:hypothetical protein